MSPEPAKSIGIIGGGCSGLVLANRLLVDSAPDKALTLYDDGAPRPDHIWGYWDAGEAFMSTARRTAAHSWPYWEIISDKGAALLGGGRARYVGVSSQHYEQHLRDALSGDNRISLETTSIAPDDPALKNHQQVYDTAHWTPCGDGLVQHFQGVHVTASQPCFDPQVATLMDFRVDQSRGVHFIYMLPFSPTHALVESTLFSPQPCEAAFYQTAISDYLARHFPSITFSHGATESGVIPMSALSYHGHATPIGLAGGALRASSGYAFYQIHRQIDGLMRKNTLQAGAHRFEQWMDKVFLRVLRHHPERAAEIFLALGKALSGDTFAAFMNGRAGPSVLAQVIAAVPKLPFIRQAI